MLPNKTEEEKEHIQQKYGYAGLEGVYINENILGLLEVLSEKIQIDRKKNSSDIVHVVCPQKEIYKKIYKDDSKIPISYNLLKKLGQVDNNGNFKEDAVIFQQDDEFYSQIKFMKDFARIRMKKDGTFEDSFFRAVPNNKYITKMRTNNKNYMNKGLVENIEDSTKNWINNYDYNSIFNRKDPPIKSILSTYLEDSSFKNFYLFFVVSNNLKIDDKNPNGIDTCDKQLQLLFDTRDFMEVIANENATGKQCNVNN